MDCKPLTYYVVGTILITVLSIAISAYQTDMSITSMLSTLCSSICSSCCFMLLTSLIIYLLCSSNMENGGWGITVCCLMMQCCFTTLRSYVF